MVSIGRPAIYATGGSIALRTEHLSAGPRELTAERACRRGAKSQLLNFSQHALSYRANENMERKMAV
eukprot:scaffold421769_cov34-Prasinocladus_malaysianus.AAC.1